MISIWAARTTSPPTGEAAEQAIAANPGIVADARANRAFLVCAVRCLAAEHGIRQFPDIGTGLPTAGNTHEVALMPLIVSTSSRTPTTRTAS